MKAPLKFAIVGALAAAVVAAIVLKQDESNASSAPGGATMAAAGDATSFNPESTAKLPRMVDLGAGKCIPCKMMKPILDDLKANYADRFTTVFIDVWENREAGEAYGIRAIPTQIFFDAEGKELFRHEGFYAKEDILGKWKELGVEVK